MDVLPFTNGPMALGVKAICSCVLYFVHAPVAVLVLLVIAK